MLFEATNKYDNALQFSRFDTENLLSTCSAHPIVLEEKNWLTAEHYFQSKIIKSDSIKLAIEKAVSGKEAFNLGKPWYRAKVSGWKKLRLVLMTRALYTKAQMYDEVRELLLSTDDQILVETSAYDHFWGLGRDQRGENKLGEVWMDVRRKLREDQK